MYLFCTNNTDIFKRTYKANSGASWASNREKGIMVVTTPEQLKRLLKPYEDDTDNAAELSRQLGVINKNGLQC